MNSTELAFEELETILTRECEAHEGLFRAASEVNKAIRESDLGALQERSSRLDGQVVAIERLEERRGECCAVLSKNLDIDRSPVKLATLCEKAPQHFRDRLSKLHVALKQIVARIATINVSNTVLLEEGLELVRGRMSLFANPSNRFAQYRNGGRMRTSSAPLHPFINQTI